MQMLEAADSSKNRFRPSGSEEKLYQLENFDWWTSRPTAPRVTFDLPECKEPKKSNNEKKRKQKKKKQEKRK